MTDVPGRAASRQAPGEPDPSASSEGPSGGRAFCVGVLVGVPLLAVGIRGAFANARDVPPAELARWVAGSAIVHDALVFPLVAAVGVAGRRWVADWAWPAVRWALFTSGIVVVVSRPYVAGYGYSPGNPTALARNYGLGVVVAIALVWAAATVWALVIRLRGSSRSPIDG